LTVSYSNDGSRYTVRDSNGNVTGTYDAKTNSGLAGTQGSSNLGVSNAQTTTNNKGQTTTQFNQGNSTYNVAPGSIFDPLSPNYNAQVANSNGKITLADLDHSGPGGLSPAYNGTPGSGATNSAGYAERAANGGSGYYAPDSAGNVNISPAPTSYQQQTVSQPQYQQTASQPASPPVDYVSLMRQSLADQQTAQTNMYNQQAADKATKIRQAIATQSQQADATKADYTNQMNTAIGTLNTERAKIPGQTATFNNTASFQGMNNERNTRNSLAQMGLLQSGESGSQQLINDVGTANRINANNLQGQQIDTNYGNQIASSQTDLASKIKAVNDAMAVARANGDENALAALTYAQNQIALSAAQNNVNMNNFQYQIGRDTTANNQWDKTFNQNVAQDNFNNSINEGQLTGYYGGIHYINGIPQTPTTSNDTYGLQSDVNANLGRNVQLYTPGQTQLGVGDVFLGGTGTGVTDSMLNGARRIYGNTAQDTADVYNTYLSNQNSVPRQGQLQSLPGNPNQQNVLNTSNYNPNQQNTLTNPNNSSALPPSISSQYPGATNVVKTVNGYKFNTPGGGLVYYGGQ